METGKKDRIKWTDRERERQDRKIIMNRKKNRIIKF